MTGVAHAVQFLVAGHAASEEVVLACVDPRRARPVALPFAPQALGRAYRDPSHDFAATACARIIGIGRESDLELREDEENLGQHCHNEQPLGQVTSALPVPERERD